jgi:hypothetical protein
MEEYITKKEYYETIKKNYSNICFAININEKNDPKNETKKLYDITFHFFEQINYFGIFDSGTPDIPSSQHVLEEFQIGPNMKGYEKYQTNGYTYLMKIISETILEQNSYTFTVNFGILPMKYNKYRLDEKFGEVIRLLGPFFIVIAYLIPLMLYTYRMVLDKETKVKEGMKIMGLTDGVYFFHIL